MIQYLLSIAFKTAKETKLLHQSRMLILLLLLGPEIQVG